MVRGRVGDGARWGAHFFFFVNKFLMRSHITEYHDTPGLPISKFKEHDTHSDRAILRTSWADLTVATARSTDRRGDDYGTRLGSAEEASSNTRFIA